MKSVSRRDFLKTSVYVGSGAILVRYLNGGDANAAEGLVNENDFWTVSAQPGAQFRQRYEGPQKVTGQKIYGVDYRARDLVGWPEIERRAIILRSPLADKTFLGFQKEVLLKSVGASRIITGDDLGAWGCKAGAPFLMPEFYVRANSAPIYYGQPLALVAFSSVDDFLAAKDLIPNLNTYFNFGNDVIPPDRASYGRTRLVRYVNQNGQEETSFVKDHLNAGEAKSSIYIKKIEKDLAESKWHVLNGRYATQSVDPMFMEPEGGLSWYDTQSGTLTLTLSTQSPHGDAIAIVDFFKDATTPKIKKVVVNCCYPGGGFGGRDTSDFPLHLAIAALAEPDVSHRIVHTRADQFQAGLKRHASNIDLTLALDTDGKFQMLHSEIKLNGGGQNNYSFAVQGVGARNAGSDYDFPRSWVDSIAYPSSAIPAGSMRGFGSLQSQFALECLLDEAAIKLDMDPISLREKNLISPAGNLLSGTPLAVSTGANKVLAAAKTSALWVDRERLKSKKTSASTLYGTGFALSVKAFGASGDAVLTGLMLGKDGTLTLSVNGIDMGNGCATTLPLVLAEVLGRPADRIRMGAISDFNSMELVDRRASTEAEQIAFSKNPYWVDTLATSQAASLSAYHYRHGVLEAGKVLLEFGLWPAAVFLLSLQGSDSTFDTRKFTLDQRGLIYKDGRTVPFDRLSQAAYKLNAVTGTQIHGFYRQRWAQAEFSIGNSLYRSEIDALTLRYGENRFSAISRKSLDFPEWSTTLSGANRLASYALIIAVEIDKATGNVLVVDAEGYLDCGPPIQAQIVEGQMEGAFAMGIGQALIEDIPLAEDGPGQGGWNLHLYHVPLARHCAISRARFHIVQAGEGEEPKGMAEVVLNPVPAAIVNAVADATSVRFKSLPLRAQDIKAALS